MFQHFRSYVLIAASIVVAAQAVIAQEPGSASCPPASPNCILCPLEEDSTVTDNDSTPSPPTGDTVRPGPTQDGATNSVYTFAGEHYASVIDLRIPGRGLDFVWARKYRSQLTPYSAIGNGWDFSYNVYLEPLGMDLVVHDGNTRADIYYFNGIDAWTCEEFFQEIYQNADLSYTMVFPNRGEWNFFPFDGSPWQGKIASIADRNGNELTLAYDVMGRLETIWDTLSRPVNITYNPDGFIETVTDFAGRSVTYDYYHVGNPDGSFGDLKSVTTPPVLGTPHGNDFPGGKTTTYTYTTGFVLPELNHDLLTITDPKGHTYLQNVYAHTLEPTDPRYTENPANLNFDRLVRQVWGDPGDIIDLVYVELIPLPENNFSVMKTIINDRVGNVEEQFHDAGNRRVMQLDYTGRAPDPTAPTTEVDNRPAGQLRPGDPPVFETRFEFNLDSLVTRIIHPNGNEETFLYDSFNPDRRSQRNLLEHCRLPGVLGGDQLTICEYFAYESGFGGCCSSNFVTLWTDGRGNVTSNGFDENGNRISRRQLDTGVLDEWEYNEVGQMTAHMLPDNGSGHRRRDEYVYYDTGPQTGYLYQTIMDVGGFALAKTYEHDAVGNVTRIVDARGNDTLYEHNALDQVVRSESRVVDLNAGPTRYERLIYYDANDNIVRFDMQNVDDQGIAQPNTHYSTVYEYDVLNQLTRMCREKAEVNLASTDLDCGAFPLGTAATTEYEYDGNRNRTLIRHGEAVNGNDPDNVVQTLYDERDLAFQVIRAPGSPNQSTTQHDYDGNGNRIRTTQGLEDSPCITEDLFDGYNRLTTSTDALGNVSTYHYDGNGNLVSSQLDGELVDLPGSSGNVMLSQTNYTYDGLDRRIETSVAFFDPVTQTPIGDGLSVTQTLYSDNSQVLRVTDDNGHATETTYDTANRRSVVTDGIGNTVTYDYDPNSNVSMMTETEKSDLGEPDEIYYTNYTYDGLDRRIRTEDIAANTRSSGYDSRDNLTLTIDGSSYENRYTYDGLDRRLEYICDMDGDGADGDGDDVVTEQVWDDSSRLITEIDDNGNSTNYEYDGLFRLIGSIHADGTTREQTYDVHDNTITVTDPNGTVVTQTYDLLDRIQTRSIVPAPGVAGVTSVTWEYDGLSRLVSVLNDTSLVHRTYDSLSNVIGETLNGQSTVHTFDGMNNKLASSYPGGRQTTFTYDVLNRKKTVADGAGPIASYDYVGPDRVERRDSANGTRAAYEYDGIPPNPPDDYGVKQIARITHSVISTGAIIDDRTYTWDAEFNMTQRVDRRPYRRDLTHDYEYDPLNRLIRTTVTDAAGWVQRDTVYGLDGAGNRTTVTGGEDAGIYTRDGMLPEPADHQLNQYTTTPAGRRVYDANGNLVAIAAAGDCNGDGLVDLADYGGPEGFAACLAGPVTPTAGACSCYDMDGSGHVDLGDFSLLQQSITPSPQASGETMVYDYRNRMLEYTDWSTGYVSTYTYDGLDRRIETTRNVTGTPETTHFFYDDWQVIEEQDGVGGTVATYVYGNNIDEVLTMQRGGQDYYYHGDPLHNVMALTDATGEVVETYEYGDYGAPGIVVKAQTPDLDELYDSDPDPNPSATAQLIADDFALEQAAAVTGLRWWGGYSYDLGAPDTDAFTVRIFDDDGGVPGTLLHEQTVGDDVSRTPTERLITSASGDVPEFEYEAALAPFVMGGLAELFWLEVDNDTTGHPTTWGWESSSDGNGNMAWSHDGGPWGNYPGDTAFEILARSSAVGNSYLFNGRRYDSESGLYYYRTRYLDPPSGRFTSRDPMGIWGDSANLGAAQTYVGSNPWTNVDPHGEITVKNHSFQALTCGGFDVKWIFSLDKPAPCDGYIVQQVDYKNFIAPCNAKGKPDSKTFWESWWVTKGSKNEHLHAKFQWTDNAYEPSHPETCGEAKQTGKIKFFCVKTTGDLGRDQKKPAKPNGGWGPGAVPMSGDLPSTDQKPKWWDQPSANGEKDASRVAGSMWDCCDPGRFNAVYASP